jgi:glutamyl-tRNA reductase
VASVETILNDELDRYLGATSAREVAPMIVAMRERAEVIRAAEVERMRARLDDLDPRQAEAVEALTRGLVAKLLHQPTVVLKDAAGSARGDRLVAALRELFEIEG